MRGTSSTSFGEVLRDAEAALQGQSGSLEPIADELFSVADAIDSSNQAVRLLSDSGRPAEVKQTAVRSLFGGRVSEPVLEIALGVVRRRWTEQEDLLDALELVGVTALLGQAQRDGSLATVEDELVQVTRLIDSSGDLTRVLDDAREDPAERGAIVTRLLTGRCDRITTLLAARAVSRPTALKPARRIEAFAEFASERRHRLFAVVVSAIALSASQQARLSAVLTGIYGREVDMNLEVDPQVVGGLRIQVGDDLYDATVLNRLARAKQQLVA